MHHFSAEISLNKPIFYAANTENTFELVLWPLSLEKGISTTAAELWHVCRFSAEDAYTMKEEWKTKIETFFKLLQHCPADLLRSRSMSDIWHFYVRCLLTNCANTIIFMNWHLFGDRFFARAHTPYEVTFHCFIASSLSKSSAACVEWVLCKH